MGLNKASIGESKKYHQSNYKLKNPLKYIGDPTAIACRSSWEVRFCFYCDTNPAILKWGSEVIEIPYVVPDTEGKEKMHRYYPDFYMEISRPDLPELMLRVVVEVKPKAETAPPIVPPGANYKQLKRIEYQMHMWQKNYYKWQAALPWCAARGYTFLIVTEDDLAKIATMLR